MAIEHQQFHFSSSFTDPNWVPSTFTSNDDVTFQTTFLESLLTQQQHQQQRSSVSENAFQVQKQEQQRFQPVSGRVTKRKSRASKRDTTTFITTDVSNFRQMVQQVTGAKVTSQVPPPIVVKPEDQTSYNNNNNNNNATMMTTPFMLDESFYVNGGNLLDNSSGQFGEFGFDGFSSFPTLESWKV